MANVIKEKGKYTFYYPCESHSSCTPYKLILSPGDYFIELYGASGGALHWTSYRTGVINQGYQFLGICPDQEGSFISNVECSKNLSCGGSGGYISGFISIKQETTAYLTLGGHGIYELNTKALGGYNGGGDHFYFDVSTSGGGATDLRFEENDLLHRVLVAGWGGSSDNWFPLELETTSYQSDDGSGGAGGGLVAQGFFISSNENKQFVATQTSGYSFGYGESAIGGVSLHPYGVKTPCDKDFGSGGGGWFGGFSSFSYNGGGGGGSSFALTEDATIPENVIEVRNSYYQLQYTGYYAFLNQTKYLFKNVTHAKGVWSGNGFATITSLTPFYTPRFRSNRIDKYAFLN